VWSSCIDMQGSHTRRGGMSLTHARGIAQRPPARLASLAALAPPHPPTPCNKTHHTNTARPPHLSSSSLTDSACPYPAA
jgi:hypothetical protein